VKAKPSNPKLAANRISTDIYGLNAQAVLSSLPPDQIIVGIDEVGRGAWAGPLLVAAVVLEPVALKGVTDSKLLSAARRMVLSRLIKSAARGVGFGWVSVVEIDAIGLAQALRLGARRAVANVACPYDVAIIDGSIDLLPDAQSIMLPKADRYVPQVASASIVAKVARDSYMHRLHRSDSRFGYDRHVGYGTAQHAMMLAQYGPTIHHRYSFDPIRRTQVR
jgi:ribonuclease HII